ncbi:OmpA family protein [Alishewanella sp. BS5-314]|uniref:OmpA family protein n=1 Tax=Alishewanella sp. BS5-314 TaxID=2755587 RepID=UPI0021BBB325|nr:OmpA family protein [Alishewanella sp. BS5-314]MCT8126601.1 OmpA family protein [Alishewanella sp. BS5-314]
MKNSLIVKRHNNLFVVCSCLPVLLAFNSQANTGQDYLENGWFIGVNLGQSTANIDSNSIRANLERSGFAVSAITEDTRHFGYKLYTGYKFTQYLALEGGYFDLGSFGFKAATLPVSDYAGETGLKGWNLDLVAMLPLSLRWSALARVGVTHNNTKTRFNSNGLVNSAASNQDDDYTKHKYGLGLQYNISDAFTMRLEAERYRMDDLIGNHGDMDLYSLGLIYRFGSTEDRYVPAAAPEPVPVIRQPVAPPPRPAPVTAEPEVLVLEDVHFNFDTAELTPDTKVILRRHVATLKANPRARVRIAGYTSASGTAAYNQALSERRAESIKTFLVSEGINANRFKTIGFGASNPAEYEAKPSALRSDAAKANMRGLFEIIVE